MPVKPRRLSGRVRAGGFTLLELLAVLAIVGILAGTALPLFSRAILETERRETIERMRRIDAAALAFLADAGRFPANLGELRIDPGAAGWCGPYLFDRFTQGIPGNRGEPDRDAWGNPFAWTGNPGGTATLRSLGRDGVTATADDLVKVVQGNPVLRAETRARLRVLNTAVLAFLRQYRPGSEFSSFTNFNSIRTDLRNRGFLPNSARYDLDAWGNAFTTDPAPSAARPVCRLRSPLL